MRAAFNKFGPTLESEDGIGLVIKDNFKQKLVFHKQQNLKSEDVSEVLKGS